METIVPYIIHNEPSERQKQREIRFLQIQSMIQEKKQLLLEKKEYLRKIHTKNKHLKEVYNDYKTYYDTILQYKRNQLMQMEKLESYVKQLQQMASNTRHNTQDAQKEHSKLVREINEIKHKLKPLLLNLNPDERN